MAASLVVLTGASGSGKTTIVDAIETLHPELSVVHFDSIGVPSAEAMAAFGPDHQPGGAWQRAMTLQWFERIVPILEAGESVLFEGQMRIAFIQEALTAYRISDTHLILVDCDDEIRSHRLTYNRQQPKLADEGMMGWAQYLREEALNAGCEILDTGKTPIPKSAEYVLLRLGL